MGWAGRYQESRWHRPSGERHQDGSGRGAKGCKRALDTGCINTGTRKPVSKPTYQPLITRRSRNGVRGAVRAEWADCLAFQLVAPGSLLLAARREPIAEVAAGSPHHVVDDGRSVFLDDDSVAAHQCVVVLGGALRGFAVVLAGNVVEAAVGKRAVHRHLNPAVLLDA